MFRRLAMMLLLAVTTCLLVMPARAATNWTAWLYEAETGLMTQVDSAGATLKQIQLPNNTAGLYSQHAAVSPSGLLVAYGVTSTTANNVYLHDLTTDRNVFQFDVPQNANTSLDFGISSLNFSQADGTFAFGYSGYDIPWKIVVIDIVAKSATSLKQEDPIAAGLAETGLNFIPTVAYNRNKQISFLMIPYGTDGMPTYKAYTWNRDANTVTPNDAYITPDTATFPLTNEVISTISDDNFPNSRMELTGFPVNNTLQVFDPTVNQRFIVTSMPSIYNPRFVQNGERIMVTHYEDQAGGSQTQSLQVMERSGALSGVVSDAPVTGITGVLGTHDGFIFSATSGDNDPKTRSTTLYTVETRQANGDFSAVSTWNSPVGTNTQLIWVSEAEPASAGPFTPWGHINPATIQPTQPAVSGGALTVGIQAQVQTTANDVLNLRSGPGTSFQRLGTIGNGTVVTLLEGPINADGLNWWRVRLETGSEGWVVDSADGVNTLVPR